MFTPRVTARTGNVTNNLLLLWKYTRTTFHATFSGLRTKTPMLTDAATGPKPYDPKEYPHIIPTETINNIDFPSASVHRSSNPNERYSPWRFNSWY